MQTQSGVEFRGESRIHMGIPVADLQESSRFYQTLFGVAPTKQRPGYAKFEPQEPSVNLSLHEVGGATFASDVAAHYGVQVKGTEAVLDAQQRLDAAGFSTRLEEQSSCCYAVQTKVWVNDPDGNRWEVFVVLESEDAQRADAASGCCSEPQVQLGCC